MNTEIQTTTAQTGGTTRAASGLPATPRTPRTRRRMRRTGRARCPQRAASASPNDQCKMLDAQCSMNPSPSHPSPISASSALRTETETKTETKTKEKRPRARPFQTLPEFAALNRDQLAYVHDILRTNTLEDAQREIWTELLKTGVDLRLDLCTLHRYKHKLLFAESLNLVDDAITATTAVDQLNDLLAGRPTKLSATGLQVVQQRALAIANDPATKPSLFTNLHRIFTYEDRKADRDRTHQFRVEQAAALNTHRTALQATREKLADDKIAMNAHRQLMDLEKIKLAQQHLALKIRIQEHREKPAPGVYTTEQQKTWNDNYDALMAYGRACLAQEREKEREKQRAKAQATTPSPTATAGGAHSTVPHSLPSSSESNALVPKSLGHSGTCPSREAGPAPCGADIPVCASEPPIPNAPNQNATNV